MSDGGLTILDGTLLRAIDFSLPESEVTLTGARVLELAESRASSSLFGLSLPESLRSSSLKRIGADAVSFRSSELHRDQAKSKLIEYVTAIGDELNDDPLVVAVLDGKSLHLFMEDEDDFAMLAENLFTDLDTEDKGKINKNGMRNALVHMGVEMGIPPFSEFPQLNDILKKHIAEGDEELGQAQFAQLLQPILEELAEALAEKHVVVIQNIKITNGSKLKKILASDKQLKDLADKIFQQNRKDGQSNAEKIRSFLEKNWKELGLPPSEADETVLALYDSIFADVEARKSSAGLEKEELGVLLKEVLENFAEQLETNPVFHDHGH